MPKPPLPPALDDFLRTANPSVIGSVQPDGSPHTAATWYLWEDARALVNMDATRKRLQYMRENPQVSLTVIGTENWYRQITLIGHVTEFADDTGHERIDQLSTHYTGQPYARRDQQRVNAWIEVQSWYGWDGGRFWRG